MKLELRNYSEICECGGVAPVIYVDKKSGVVTLKCNKCGDMFEAEDSIWLQPSIKKN